MMVRLVARGADTSGFTGGERRELLPLPMRAGMVNPAGAGGSAGRGRSPEVQGTAVCALRILFAHSPVMLYHHEST